MATSETINVESLLAATSQFAPTGVNLRTDSSPSSIYFALKDARSGARATERRVDGEGESVRGLLPEWQSILSLAPQALAENSKDLEIAAWLTEALVRAHGFAGLRDGLKLMRGLVERYWDGFFSLEDEEGMPTRLAPLAGLNGQGNEGTLMQPLRKVPITAGRNDDLLAIYHYDQARALARMTEPDARARREAAGEVSMERFTAAVSASGGEFYVSLLEDLEAALGEIRLLATALTERAGRIAPSLSDIGAVVTTVHDVVASVSADLVAKVRASMAETGKELRSNSDADHDVREGLVKAGDMVLGRDEALRTLQQVADFFRKNEPHSPIATSLDEMVRRARMPFADLLAELLPDSAAWRSALVSAGIKPPPPAE